MLEVHLDAERHVPGVTLFAEDGNRYWIACIAGQPEDGYYEVTFGESADALDEKRIRPVDTAYFARTLDEAAGLLDAFSENLEALVESGRMSHSSLLGAWEEL